MNLDGDSEFEDQSNQERAFEAFMCPLTKEVMQDPVTIETGQTFEREAILKWFKECRDNGRKATCPLTQRELRSTEISPSIALRNVIEEWRARNEEKELEKACNSLLHYSESESEDGTLRALVYISQMCQRSGAKKNLVRSEGIVPTIAEMLKSSSRRVRLKSLQVLGVVVEDSDENKEELGKGDTIRTIIKFLSNEHFQERELAVSLLYELSKYEPTCQRIGAVYGAILLLVGMASSKSENVVAVDKAEKTLRNLDKYETNTKQMAENGRLQPLLTKLLQGTPEVQVAMAEYLGDLALANDVKVAVAEQVGPLLVSIMRKAGSSLPAREATLKALREISSNESSARMLLQAGILPPLVKHLFSVGVSDLHLPMRLKEVSAAILANLVASGAGFQSIPLDDDESSKRTLLSEDVVHSLLHLVSNTGPAIECKLLNTLVGLTSSPATVAHIVSAIKSSGATISLIQFVEAAHREIRVESLKVLRNVSPYMGGELADALGGHLSSLVRAITDSTTPGVTEEQAAAVGLLGELPERDWGLTRQLFELGAFTALSSKLAELRRGAIRGNRHVTPLTEGMVKVMYRITCALQEDAEYVEFAREAGLAPLFVDLLQMNGLDTVQLYSAMALEKLSDMSRSLTAVPPPLAAASLALFMCFGSRKKPARLAGVCRVHGGFCSLRETFCLAQPGAKAVERLVACLDHLDAGVVEAALAAVSTLVGDGVEDVSEGVVAVGEAEGLRPVVEILVESRTEALHRRAVWVVERILRVEEIAREVAADQTVASALVEAYRNGDPGTRHTAERALKHLDRIPSFSTTASHTAARQ